MKVRLLQASLVFVLVLAFLHFAVPQKPTLSYESLLSLYADAERHYNKATGLSRAANYGAREEALEKDWNAKALKGFAAVYRQTPAHLAVYDSLRFQAAFRIGELHHYFDRPGEAVAHYQQAIAIKEKSLLPDSLLFKPLLYAGIVHYHQNKFDTAAALFKRAERIQTVSPTPLSEGERLYNLLGVLHYERGNYRQAKNYFQQALALLAHTHPYYEELYVNYQINLAQLHMRLEEYDKADRVYQSLLPRGVHRNEIHHNIGTLKLRLGAAKEALLWYQKVNYQNSKIVRLYNGIGEAFFKLKQFDSAFHYYQKAIEKHVALGANGDAAGYGLVLQNLGDYHLHFQNHTLALEHYQKALHQFYPAFADADIHHNPDRFSGVFSYIQLFTALTAKAEAWHQIYLRHGGQKAAQEEIKAYKAAFRLSAYVERTYDSDEARLFLSKTKHAVRSRPMDAAFALYRQTGARIYLEDLYFFDRQNKATVLTLNRQRNAAAEPGSLFAQKEQAVKVDIARLSIKAALLTNTVQTAAISNAIRNREIELGKLQERLYPEPALQEAHFSSLTDLQRLLDKKTALVSYHLSSERLTALIVTHAKVSCHQQALPADFDNRIRNEIRLLKNPPQSALQTQDLRLSQLLLANIPVADLAQLIVIPDDVLAYLPFESLRDNDGRYLIEKLAIQYQFSTALLGENKTDFSDAQTLAFAPFAHQSSTDSLPRLPATAQEIAAARGKKFIDTAATKAAFLQYCHGFPVLHLATHAFTRSSEDGFSGIAFSPSAKAPKDNLLYAQEIYNLRLQKTDLVILSACETGAGYLAKGEGVLSLSRAFAYAGCSNVVTSLWKADDFSTAYITARVHTYLTKGFSIAEALQRSKLDYLSDISINPRLKQPYYWAHLVFIGNYSPQKRSNWIWATAAVVPLLLLFFFYRKRFRRNKILND